MMPGDAACRSRAEPVAGAAVLDLLRPADLPVEITLPPDAARRMHEALSAILAILDQSDGRASALLALLGGLEGDGPRAVPVRATGIPARTAEVAEFDRYFHLRRVEAAQPAIALLRGLLQTAIAVLALVERAPALPEASVARQVAGFAAYARLLGRICGLEPLR